MSQFVRKPAIVPPLAPKTIFVSLTGDDADPGTAAAPMASLAAAVAAMEGAGQIIMREGDYFDAQLDASDVGALKIKAYSGARVRTFHGEKVTAFTAHGGSVKTWKATIETVIAEDTDNRNRVFEWDTPYGIITEPHPLEKGRTHRLEHTPLTRVADIATVDAGNGRFFFDSGTGILYITATDGGNPNGRDYWVPATDEEKTLIYNCQPAADVEIYGIESYFGKYGADLRGCATFKTVGCTWFGNFHGVISGTNVATSGLGTIVGEHFRDDFLANADDNGVFSVSLGGVRGIVKLVDVWSAEGGDEGYNAHELAVATFEGGLFENNRSGGITIPIGNNVTVRDSYTRANGSAGIVSAINPENNFSVNGWISDGDYVGLNMTHAGAAILHNCTILNPVSSPFVINGSGGLGSPTVRAYNQRVIGQPSGLVGGAGNSDPHTIAVLETGNPALITTDDEHGFLTGQKVTIAGVTGGTYSPTINATYAVTVLSPKKFTVPVDCTVIGTDGTVTAVNEYGGVHIHMADSQRHIFAPASAGARSTDASVALLTYIWNGQINGISMPEGSSSINPAFNFEIEKCRGRRFKIRALFGDQSNSNSGAFSGDVVWKGVICSIVTEDMASTTNHSPGPFAGYDLIANDVSLTFTPPSDGPPYAWKKWVETDSFTMPANADIEWSSLCVYRLGADAADTHPRAIVLLQAELVEVPEQG